MRMSELIRRKVLEARCGGLLNRLKIGKRRNTLFFSDIFTDYVKECEDQGYGKEMMEAGREWMILYFKALVPRSIKKLPLFIFGNTMKNVWVNAGLMDDFHISEKSGLIEIKTGNEVLTSAIGKNQFSVGLFMGICNVLFNSEVDTISVSQSRSSNVYVFKTTGVKPSRVMHKTRHAYNQLNQLPPIEKFTLVDALKSNVLQLKENRIYFRGKAVQPVESTLFHILGCKNILIERVPEISYNFFKKNIGASSTKGKLSLLKTLLQVMGWGSVNIIVKKDVVFEIKNPPYGIQKEKDNWDFLINSVLGYLWLIDRDFGIREVSESRKYVKVTYGR